MKKDQRGLAHLYLVGIAVLLVGLGSFTTYRVMQSNNNLSNTPESANDAEPKKEIVAVEEEKADEVDVTKEEEAKPVEEPKKIQPKPDPVKKEKVYLNISSESVAQDGAVLYVRSVVEKAVSGTCNFKLYQEGYNKVYSSNKISNSQNCEGQLDISNLPTYDGWGLHVWFDGDDGKTYAYQDVIQQPLTDPN